MVELVSFDLLYFTKSKIWLSDPVISSLTDSGKLPDDVVREKWFENLKNRADYLIWGLEYKKVPIGVCGIKNINDGIGEYWGYIGEKEYWGRGIGKEMMHLVENKAIMYRLDKLTLRVLCSNFRAIQLYKRMGYNEVCRDTNYFYFAKKLR